MSLVESLYSKVPCLGWLGWGSLYIKVPCRGVYRAKEIQCIMGNGHMGTPVDRLTDWQTDMTENVTVPQIHWRTVIKRKCKNNRAEFLSLKKKKIAKEFAQNTCALTGRAFNGVTGDSTYFKFP